MSNNKITRLIKNLYPSFGLKRNDILLASYPKSGNTWFRFIWLNIISLMELDGLHINFHSINGPLNASYDLHSYGKKKYTSLPRIVKTHKLYIPAFKHCKSILIVRNPADVMLSYYEYIKYRLNNSHFSDDISLFIRSTEYGVEKWCQHVQSWKENASTIVKYESLKDDTFNQIRTILQELSISERIEDCIIKEAIERSTFKEMREIEDRYGIPNMNKKFKDGFKFTRKGQIGEWKKHLVTSDVLYINNIIDLYKLNELYHLKN